MRTRVMLLLPLLLAAAGVAYGSPLKPVTIGFGGGVSVPVNDAGDTMERGWHGTGIVKLNLPMMPVGLSGSFSYHRFSLDRQAVGFDGSGRILAGLANATVSLPLPGPIKPYITAGVGTFNIKADPDSAGAPAAKSTTEFGIDAGAGLSISLPGTGIQAFIEGKIMNIYTDQGLNSAVVNDFKTQIIPVTFGIFF